MPLAVRGKLRNVTRGGVAVNVNLVPTGELITGNTPYMGVLFLVEDVTIAFDGGPTNAEM